jgi:drug/metabolite transporter (DMT)-like permease
LTAYGFLFAALGLGLTQNGSTLFTMGARWDGWLILAGLAVGPSLFGYGLYTTSLRYLPAGMAGLISALEPALTALLAIALLHERLAGLQWLGVGVIIAAVILAQTGVKPAPSAAPKAAGAIGPLERDTPGLQG